MFRSIVLPSIALLSFTAFMCGVFFRGFDQPLFAPALLCVYGLGALIFSTGYRGGWAFPPTAVSGFLGAFWLWIGASLFWTDVFYISTIFVLIIGALPMLFFAVMSHPERGCVTGALSAGLCAGAVLLGVWAVIQFVFLGDLVGSRVSHPMLNPNNLAVLLVMAVFPVAGAVHYASARLKPLLAGMAVILIAATVMTQSRGGMLGLLAGLGLFAGLGWPAARKEWKYYLVAGCAGVLAVAAILFSIVVTSGATHLTGGGTAGQSVDVRFMLWDAGFRMLRDHLFTPVGLGNFYLVFPSYRHFDDVSDGYFLHADPLQFAIETGFSVLVLFYGFAVAVLLRTVRATCAASSEQRFAIIVPFCSLLALMVNAHLNFDLYMLPAILFGAAMLCAWHHATEAILRTRTVRAGFRMPGVLTLVPILLIVFVAGPVWLVRAGYGVAELEKASLFIDSGQAAEARRAIDNVQRFGPGSYYRADYLDGVWYASQLRDIPKGDPRAAAVMAQADAAFDASTVKNPYHTHSIVQEAQMHFLRDPGGEGRDQAKVILQEALRIDPFNMDARVGLSNVLEVEGDTTAAIEVLEQGLQWRIVQKYAPLQYRDALIRLYIRQGVEPDVIEQMKLEVYKTFAGRRMQLIERQRLDRWIDDKIEDVTEE